MKKGWKVRLVVQKASDSKGLGWENLWAGLCDWWQSVSVAGDQTGKLAPTAHLEFGKPAGLLGIKRQPAIPRQAPALELRLGG